MSKFFRLVAILIFAAIGHASNAATVTFNLDTVISGQTLPFATPWMTATFEDVAANTVRMTLTNTTPGGGTPQTTPWIDRVGFNILVDPGTITPVRLDGPLPVFEGFSTGGPFDVEMNFAPPLAAGTPPPPAADQLFIAANGPVVFRLTGGAGFSAESFLEATTLEGGGTFYMAAHWNALGDGTLDNPQHGGFIGAPIPEPEIYAMMLAGLGLMGFVARRRKQQLGAAA